MKDPPSPNPLRMWHMLWSLLCSISTSGHHHGECSLLPPGKATARAAEGGFSSSMQTSSCKPGAHQPPEWSVHPSAPMAAPYCSWGAAAPGWSRASLSIPSWFRFRGVLTLPKTLSLGPVGLLPKSYRPLSAQLLFGKVYHPSSTMTYTWPFFFMW